MVVKTKVKLDRKTEEEHEHDRNLQSMKELSNTLFQCYFMGGGSIHYKKVSEAIMTDYYKELSQLQTHYSFFVSGRVVNLEKSFSRLKSDELCEIICEDKGYARWVETKQLLEMEAFDLLTILNKHPSLVEIFTKTALKRGDN